MLRARVLTAVAVAFAFAATAAVARPAPASARAKPPLTLQAKPSLFPAFRADAHDYAVRCRSGQPVALTVAARKGVKVAVGDRAPRGGRFGVSASLVPGGAVTIVVHVESRAQSYSIRCVPSDLPRWKARRSAATSSGWYVLTPSMNGPRAGYVVVLDGFGAPVWWMKGDPPPWGGELLPDGTLAWTRWVFSRPISGYFEAHALDGSLVHTFDTVPTGSNPHELRVMPDGSAFLVSYRTRDGVDLSRWGGPSNAPVLDGEVQEIDRHGKLVWSWNSAGHVALSESVHWYPKVFHDRPVRLTDGRGAWDIVHLNSIESAGSRVIVSLRHTDAVYAIDRPTGAIAWKLGGTRTSKSLKILGDRYGGADLGGQHDARVWDDGRTISVFDNGTRRGRAPRVLVFRIDQSKRIARLVRTIVYPGARSSTCCGSARRLPGGHWLVSWGNSPYVTELTASGRPALTLKLHGDYITYRAEPVPPGALGRGALRRGMDAMARREAAAR